MALREIIQLSASKISYLHNRSHSFWIDVPKVIANAQNIFRGDVTFVHFANIYKFP